MSWVNVVKENVTVTGYWDELAAPHATRDMVIYFLHDICLSVAIVYKVGHNNGSMYITCSDWACRRVMHCLAEIPYTSTNLSHITEYIFTIACSEWACYM
jgi:hypothetical protein